MIRNKITDINIKIDHFYEIEEYEKNKQENFENEQLNEKMEEIKLKEDLLIIKEQVLIEKETRLREIEKALEKKILKSNTNTNNFNSETKSSTNNMGIEFNSDKRE